MSDLQNLKSVDLEALKSVTVRLREAVDEYSKDRNNLFVLDSVIKRFELTYELTFRSLRRYLLDYSASEPEIQDMSFAGIIRRGHKEQLLRTGWPGWKEFKEARNLTVHTYRQETATQVAEEAAAFLPEAEHLLKALQQRIKING